ncbi:MAG: NAD(P)H-hydrate dehydratase [Chloroflexota bacterium]
MKLVSVEEMRQIEIEADKFRLSYSQMMENAGHGISSEIELLAHSEDEEREVLGLVGKGNNGGDTLIALSHLASNGWKARAYLVSRGADTDGLIDRLKKAGGEIIISEEDDLFDKLSAFVSTADVIIDGILGTGIKLPLSKEISVILDTVNTTIADLNWPPYVVGVDCPSGVDCDSGEAADEVIPASLTICMGAVKKGLLKFPAFDLTGELRVVDIGFTDAMSKWNDIQQMVVDDEIVEDILPVRPSDAHKGTFGTVLIAAGSINYIGAPLLAGKAAYRIGAGLVQMAVPGMVQAALAGHFPEATWIILPQELGVISEAASGTLAKNMDRATAILVGPGIGTEVTTKAFLENFLQGRSNSKKTSSRLGFTHADEEKPVEENRSLPPMIFDADGLRLLSKIDLWHKLLPAGSILTPHPGEMASLTGLEKDAIQSDRVKIASRYAAEWGHIVILKGAVTVIAAPDGRVSLIPVATPALARAGTGDVLAGLVAGLRAQGIEAFESAVAAAWIHAQAGLLAAERLGTETSVMAGDLLDAIPEVISGF